MKFSSAQPGPERNPESLFWAFDQLAGHEVVKDGSQQMLRSQRADSKSQWTREREFDEPMIQQGFAPFESDAHRHTVNFDQNVTGKIVVKVPRHHRFRERAAEVLKGQTIMATVADKLGNLSRRRKGNSELEHGRRVRTGESFPEL